MNSNLPMNLLVSSLLSMLLLLDAWHSFSPSYSVSFICATSCETGTLSITSSGGTVYGVCDECVFVHIN